MNTSNKAIGLQGVKKYTCCVTPQTQLSSKWLGQKTQLFDDRFGPIMVKASYSPTFTKRDYFYHSLAWSVWHSEQNKKSLKVTKLDVQFHNQEYLLGFHLQFKH